MGQIYLIRKVLVTIALLPFFLMAGLQEPGPEENSALEEREACAEMAYNQLKEPEKKIYDLLGATYRKIYLFVLNNEERNRVVILVRRGLDAHVAINSILRSAYRKQMRSQKKQKELSPAARSLTTPPKKYTIY